MATMRAFSVAAIALAGFVLSLAPMMAGLDDALLDLEWKLLRKYAPRPAPDDIAAFTRRDAAWSPRGQIVRATQAGR